VNLNDVKVGGAIYYWTLKSGTRKGRIAKFHLSSYKKLKEKLSPSALGQFWQKVAHVMQIGILKD